jgi:hypothetical protein
MEGIIHIEVDMGTEWGCEVGLLLLLCLRRMLLLPHI